MVWVSNLMALIPAPGLTDGDKVGLQDHPQNPASLAGRHGFLKWLSGPHAIGMGICCASLINPRAFWTPASQWASPVL